MEIHPAHAGLAVTLHHAQKFPPVPLVEAGVIRQQIERCNAVGAHILHHHMEQAPGDPVAAAVLLRIDGADVGGEVLPVMKIVFDDTQTAHDPVAG